LPPARATPVLRAGRARLAALQARRAGDAEAADAHGAEAVALLRSVGAKPLLAETLLEHAVRDENPNGLEEARKICGQLGAAKWLERAGAVPGVAA
jgi:hypothetical protein